MITGDGEIQIMGSAADVEIMGFGADALPPGVTCPPGANYCTGKSQLSPADLARVQQENMALQTHAASKQTAVNIAVAVGLVLLLGGGVMYATRK